MTARGAAKAGRPGPPATGRRPAATSKNATSIKIAGTSERGSFRYDRVDGMVDAGRDVTLTVRTVLSVPLAGSVPVAGLKLHETPAGRPGHVNVNWSVKPFWEFSARLKLAELPTGIVAERDEIVPLTP